MNLLFLMRRFLLRTAIFFVALGLILASFPAIPANASAECSDIFSIFARGSGSAANESEDYLAFSSALSSTLSRRAPTLTNRIFDLGSDTTNQNSYLDVSIEDPTIILGATFDLDGKSPVYSQSVQTGIAELTQLIRSTLVACPQTKFVLAGYSQGAQVISATLLNGILAPEQLIYAATFGDPKLYLPEGHKNNIFDTPKACYGKDYSVYRINVPDCEVEHGFLGSFNPYILDQYRGKIGTWCNEADPICGSYFDFQHAIFHNASYEGGKSNYFTNLLYAHLAYNSDHSYQEASELIADQLKNHFPSVGLGPITPRPTSATQDVAFLIDSTGSMSSLIDNYKNEARTLAQQIVTDGGRIALYEYRDLNDPFSPVQHCDFSCDLATFSAELDGITVDGGDDDLESALSASSHVLDTLDWRYGATKSLVILTDAGYHNPDRDGTTQSQVVQRSLAIDPVNFYVITPDPAIYAELAELTGGRAFSSISELETSSTFILDRPIAQLSTMHYSGIVDSPISFDASASSAITPATIDHYEWDLDFDGIFEHVTTDPVISNTYNMPASGYIQVKVVDNLDRHSTMSAQFSVRASNTTQPTLSNLTTHLNGSTCAQFNFRKSDDTYLALVLVNEQILGFTDSTVFLITSLPAEAIDVTVIPVDSQGRRGPALQITTQASSNNTPIHKGNNPYASINSDSNPTPNTNKVFDKKEESMPPKNEPLPAVPRAPNTGTR